MTDGPAELQFVILEHGNREGVHWDLLVETELDKPLRTWRLAQDPTRHVGAIPATPIADHRRHYLDFEGELTGGRGTVARVDRGQARWLSSAAGEIRLSLLGCKLRGVYVLRRHMANVLVFEPGTAD